MPWGHCYYFLCFSSPARVAFSENTKKKKTSFEIDQAAARPRPVTLASACKLHDTTIENPKADENQGESHFQVEAWTTKIVKGSFFKLQSSWDGASKLKKMAFGIHWCVLEYFKPSTFALTLEARQRWGRSTTTLTLRRSLLHQQIRGKVWRWSSPQNGINKGSSLLPVFWGNCHGWRPCRGERLGEDAGKDTCLQSNKYFCDAMCGDIVRKTSFPKGHRRLPRTGNLLRDWKLHNNRDNRLAEQW